VQGFALTDRGERLRRIYAEGDILVVEGLSEGTFDGLSPSELAALVSSLVYESRERAPQRAEMPTARLRERYRDLSAMWSAIRRAEDQQGVALCRELDPGFMGTLFTWAEGKPLEDVLAASGLAAGDFVRNCKQALDLLRQIEEAAGEGVRAAARAARAAVDRSVVSYSGLDAVG
jgi:ATP-dependent RNA helicase HelY